MAANSVTSSEILSSDVGYLEYAEQHTVPMEREPIESSYSNEIYSTQLKTSSVSYLFVKRVMDVAVSGILLLLHAPLFLLMAAAVRMTSPGPIFYRERRVGRFGKHFTIYKFRSMYTKEYLREIFGLMDTEHTQMQWRIEKKHIRDPRITKVGSIMRKLSLDELPQLINILKGDMSLVGPRPVVDAELSHYGSDAVFYRLMYPGLTGLWQVSGRNDVSYPARVQMDVAYCKRWSLLLDFAIVARTVPAVLKRKGAY